MEYTMNLEALLMGRELNNYQMVLANKEYNALMAELIKLRPSTTECKHDWYGIDQIHSKCRNCGRIERDD